MTPFNATSPSTLRQYILDSDLWLLDVKHVRAVGHLVTEPLALLMEIHAGLRPKKQYVILAPSNVTEHKWFLEYLAARGFLILTDPTLTEMARRIFWELGRVILTNDYVANEACAADIFKLSRLSFVNRFPYFKLTERDESYLQHFRSLYNVHADRWIATLHMRFSVGRLQDNNGAHNFRNTDPEGYVDLSDYIWDQGGVLVRVGDMADIDLGNKMIDIPKLMAGRRDCRLDLCLVAASKIFIGCSSGMNALALAFNVPSALVNLIPANGGYKPTDYCLYKKIRDKRTGGLATIESVLPSVFARADFYHKFPSWHEQYEFLDNDRASILGCVSELIESLGVISTFPQSITDGRLSELFLLDSYPFHSCGRLSRFNWVEPPPFRPDSAVVNRS